MHRLFFSLFFVLAFQYLLGIEGAIIKTTDSSYRDRWDKTLGKTVPKITNAEYIFTNQTLFLGVVVNDYALNKNNECNINYSITIYSPNNEVVQKKQNLKVLSQKIDSPQNYQMSDDFMYLTLDNNSVLGEYRIEINIQDRVNHQEKKIINTIDLVALPTYNSITINQNENFSDWMSGYYENKKPENVLAYYVFFTKSPIADQEDHFFPIFSFFKEIFSENPFMFQEFNSVYSNESEKTKNLLLYLLYQSVDKKTFLKIIPDDSLYKRLKETHFPDSYSEIKSAVQLDMLWSNFYATGKQKPILYLVKALENSRYKGALENYKTSEKTPWDKEKAIRNACYEATEWSLSNHIHSSDLIASYANWIMANENLSEIQRRELGILLSKSN